MLVTNEIAEELASTMKHLGCLPPMHNAALFPQDIADFMEFQIHCELNQAGRLVYSISDTQARNKFKATYKELYGYEVKETPASIRGSYPATGSDSINDISPNTICRMIQVEAEFNPMEASSIPVFVQKLAEEIQQWEEHFAKMAKSLGELRKKSDQIYEKFFSNSE